jgi:hypothetical protein
MRAAACLAIALCLVLPLPAQAPGKVLGPGDLAGKVEASRLSRTVNRLVSCGTRHTLSDPFSPTRGIGAAQHWLGEELQAMTRLAGSRLLSFEDRFSAGPGPGLPRKADLVNLGVMLPGTDPERAREALVVVAHYDSRAGNPLDAAADAPGAVDNASGVAAVLEMATVLAAESPAVSIYFVATAGGEQGNLGSQRLVQRLKAQGTEVLGMVAADRVGNSQGADGARVSDAVRLFSDGMPAQESDGMKRIRELLGTENDGAGRELARYLRRAGERWVEGLDSLVLLRRDRVGENGEQAEFARAGFPAVQVTELLDNYDHLRQDVRPGATRGYGDTVAFFDAGYCARITRMLVAAFRALAWAPAPPQNVGLGGIGTSTAKLWWTLPEDPRVQGIVIYRRHADGVVWQQTHAFPKGESVDVPGSSPDTDVFGVATVDAQGAESLPATPRSVDLR